MAFDPERSAGGDERFEHFGDFLHVRGGNRVKKSIGADFEENRDLDVRGASETMDPDHASRD